MLALIVLMGVLLCTVLRVIITTRLYLISFQRNYLKLFGIASRQAIHKSIFTFQALASQALGVFYK